MTSTADPEFKKLQIILATLRFCIVMLVLVFILYAKAQHFDETELIAIRSEEHTSELQSR